MASAPSPASATTVEVGFLVEDEPHAAADERVVVGEQDADRPVSAEERTVLGSVMGLDGLVGHGQGCFLETGAVQPDPRAGAGAPR